MEINMTPKKNLAVSISLALLALIAALSAGLTAGYFSAPNTTGRLKFSTTYGMNPLAAPELDPAATTEVEGRINAFSVDVESHRIALAASTGVQIYDLNAMKEIYALPLRADISQIKFSPDGKKLALTYSEFDAANNRILRIVVYDAAAWNPIYKIERDGNDWSEPGALAWSPDSRSLALVQPENMLSVIDISTGKTLASQSDEIFFPRVFAWSPDGKRLVANGDWGQTLRRWNVQTNQAVRLFNQKVGSAQTIAWSPNGRQIAAGYYGGDVCLWNASNNQCEGLIRAHLNSVDSLGWSPDSQRIATASGAIRVWDVKSGQEENGFGYHPGLVYKDLQWLDNSTLITLENNDTLNIRSAVRVWDAKTGKVKFAFQGWGNVESFNSGGVLLRLDDIKIAKDHAVIQVSLRMVEPDTNIAGSWGVTLTDSDGFIYPLTDITPPDADMGATRVYQTVPIAEGKRLILNLSGFPDPDLLPIFKDIPDSSATLTLDPSLLTENKPFVLNQYVNANGYAVLLHSVAKLPPAALAFKFMSEGFYNGAMLYSPSALGSESKPADGDTFTSLLQFESIPSQPFEVSVSRIYYNAFGPWTLEFDVAPSMLANLPRLKSPAILPPNPPPVYASQDSIFLEVKALADKFDDSILKDGAGWVHTITDITSKLDSGQNYPPSYYQEEVWYEVDSQGAVIRSLTTHWGRDKRMLQRSVSTGTHHLNLTYGGADEFPTYQLSFASFLTDLDNATQSGSEATREETACEDGAPCLLITLEDSIIRRAWFNLQTGQETKFQISQRTESNAEEILTAYDFLSVGRVPEPPGDILGVFETVLFPDP